MRQNCCRFDSCKKKLLDRELSTLSRTQLDHVRRCHRHRTYHAGLNDAVFRFKRDPSQQNEYVCWCGKLFSSYYNLSIHIFGFKRKARTQRPCPKIADQATEISTSKDVYDDDKQPTNYWPAEVFAQLHQDQDQEMSIDVEETTQDEEYIDDESLNSSEDESREQEIKIAIQELNQKLSEVQERRNRRRK